MATEKADEGGWQMRTLAVAFSVASAVIIIFAVVEIIRDPSLMTRSARDVAREHQAADAGELDRYYAGWRAAERAYLSEFSKIEEARKSAQHPDAGNIRFGSDTTTHHIRRGDFEFEFRNNTETTEIIHIDHITCRSSVVRVTDIDGGVHKHTVSGAWGRFAYCLDGGAP